MTAEFVEAVRMHRVVETHRNESGSIPDDTARSVWVG